MLTKSQAKTFFLVGTAVCSLAFVLLTLDTFKRIPEQTRQADLNESAIRGKHLFDQNNCMGCHTIFGEGAYYAPELTKVWERRGEAFIKAMLKDPQAMYPNDRKMTNFHLTDQQIDDLTAFLKWAGNVDLNGFPAKPDLKPAEPAAVAAAEGQGVAQPAVFGQVCVACHALQGRGGNVGPALDGVGSLRDEVYLQKWLVNPQDVKPDAKMPKLPLTEKDIQELVAYLSKLK